MGKPHRRRYMKRVTPILSKHVERKNPVKFFLKFMPIKQHVSYANLEINLTVPSTAWLIRIGDNATVVLIVRFCNDYSDKVSSNDGECRGNR